jgi:acetolactate synthase regulatory subunit
LKYYRFLHLLHTYTHAYFYRNYKSENKHRISYNIFILTYSEPSEHKLPKLRQIFPHMIVFHRFHIDGTGRNSVNQYSTATYIPRSNGSMVFIIIDVLSFFPFSPFLRLWPSCYATISFHSFISFIFHISIQVKNLGCGNSPFDNTVIHIRGCVTWAINVGASSSRWAHIRLVTVWRARRFVFMLSTDLSKVWAVWAVIIVCTKGRVKMYCVLVICYMFEE